MTVAKILKDKARALRIEKKYGMKLAADFLRVNGYSFASAYTMLTNQRGF